MITGPSSDQLALPPPAGHSETLGTNVHVHVHGLDDLIKERIQNGFTGDSQEIDDLRTQVKELMRRNQELAADRDKGSGNDEASKQASAELASAINALRRRVSCMDRKMDEAPEGHGGRGRRATLRRASSAESLFAAAAPGSGGAKLVMDLTSVRAGADEDHRANSADPDARERQRRSTCNSMSFDLSNWRHTIKTNQSVKFEDDGAEEA